MNIVPVNNEFFTALIPFIHSVTIHTLGDGDNFEAEYQATPEPVIEIVFNVPKTLQLDSKLVTTFLRNAELKLNSNGVTRLSGKVIDSELGWYLYENYGNVRPFNR